MSKENKNIVVPKLRFPEFTEADEWKTEPFGGIYSFLSTNSFTRDDLNYESGTVKNIHYGDIHTRFATLFDVTKEIVPFVNASISLEKISTEAYCVEGDMIFADASEDLKDVGKSIEVFFLNNEKVLSGMHTLQARQKEKKLVVGFAGHLFISEDIRRQIQREAQGAKVLGISAPRLSNTIICYPKNNIEQQKIASCLSSLDDLIAAHTQKLEALKAHKKGLMQQLFPAEGEKVPKLRFMEIRNSGEWEEKTLGSIADNLDAKRIPITENQRIKGDIPYYGASGIIDYVLDYIFDENLLCISEDGANLIARNYPIAFSVTGKTWVNNHAHVLRFSSSYTQIIVENYLNEINLENFLTGMAQPKLNQAKLDIIPIPLPNSETEQRKIASCIFSLNDLITEETEMMEQLKLHKKGLMQGLFPNLNENNI